MKLRKLVLAAGLLAVGLFSLAQTDYVKKAYAGTFTGYPVATSITGAETIPADTNLSGGRNPQTVNIPISLFGGGTTYNTPTANTTVTATASTGKLILTPAGTLSSLQVVFPAATGLVDGQQFSLSSNQTLTVLTATAGSGTTIDASTKPTALTISTTGAFGYRWIYRLSTTTWMRLE